MSEMNTKEIIQIIEKEGDKVTDLNEHLFIFLEKLLRNKKPIYVDSDAPYTYELFDFHGFYILRCSWERKYPLKFYILPKDYINKDVRCEVLKLIEEKIKRYENDLKNIDKIIEMKLPEHYGRKRVVYYKCPECGEIGWTSPQKFKKLGECYNCHKARYVKIKRGKYIDLLREKINKEIKGGIIFWHLVKQISNIIFENIYINTYSLRNNTLTLTVREDILGNIFLCEFSLFVSSAISIYIRFSQRFSERVINLLAQIEDVIYETRNERNY